ncbi:hydrogenase expression/formation protein, partial [Escherichia coli]|nr:hydrogenase expression/formation protein [Escherichia coli]
MSKRQPPLVKVMAVVLLKRYADDRRLRNPLLGEGEVSVRIQQADDSESEIQEAIFCGLWRRGHRRGAQVSGGKTETGGVRARGGGSGTRKTFAPISLSPPPLWRRGIGPPG